MSAIISLITGPIGELLGKLLGPLLAFVGGWTIAKRGDEAKANAAVAATLQREATASAAAPKTPDEVSTTLRDPKKEF